MARPLGAGHNHAGNTISQLRDVGARAIRRNTVRTNQITTDLPKSLTWNELAC
jgi:hypothetical protein